jgi:predicted DNA-binding transcriptional regulator AlpA
MKKVRKMEIKKLRAKDVARVYGIGLSTVWHYVKQGLLSPIKISERVTVFDIKELDKFFGIE